MYNRLLKHHQDGRFAIFGIEQIYDKQDLTPNSDLWVPNVGNLIWDHEARTLYTVTHVNSDGTSEKEAVFDGMNFFIKSIMDTSSIHTKLNTYKHDIRKELYVDNLSDPVRVTVDHTCAVYGEEFTHAKFFLGTDVSEHGHVISQTINENGAIVSESVDLVALDPLNNAMKRPRDFHSVETLIPGQVVTMVCYYASGRGRSTEEFIIRDGAAICGPNVTNVYVTDVSLISGLIDPNDPTLIINPQMNEINTGTMRCRVHYNDNNYKDVLIDGVQASLLGLNAFDTNSISRTGSLVLSYTLAANEQAVNASGRGRVVTKKYRVKNVPQFDGPQQFKIYLVPRMVSGKYELSYFLTDVDYSIDIDVTDKVVCKQTNGLDFNGSPNGQRQILDISLTLDDVLPGAYPDVIHTQTTQLTLNALGDQTVTPWEIDYQDEAVTLYGLGVVARATPSGDKTFTVNSGANTRYDWLTRLYGNLDPIFDEDLLATAPQPTHFRMEHNGVDVGTFTVDRYSQRFSLGAENDFDINEPVIIHWLNINNGTERHLAIAPVPIYFG